MPSWGGQGHLDLHLQVFPQQAKEEQKCTCLRLLMHSAARQRSPRGDATADPSLSTCPHHLQKTGRGCVRTLVGTCDSRSRGVQTYQLYTNTESIDTLCSLPQSALQSILGLPARWNSWYFWLDNWIAPNFKPEDWCSEVLHGFLRRFQENDGIVPHIKPRPLPSAPSASFYSAT